MATSGSKDFNVNTTTIIHAALRKIGAFDSGQTPAAGDYADARMALNVMVKAFPTQGIDLPWRLELTLFLQPGTQSYAVGPSGWHVTASYVETTLAAAAASSATTITLTSTTGLANGNTIGIKLNSGQIHWTTIGVAATTTITTGLAGAAAVGNAVYAYVTKAPRPNKLVFAHRRDSATDTPVDLIGEIAYRHLSRKAQQGPVNQCFYQPTLTNGTLRAWPTGGSGGDKLLLIAQPSVDDFDATSDEPQFPDVWQEALIYNLADRLAPEYPVDKFDRQMIKAEAVRMLTDVTDYDVENASVIFGRESA